MRKSVLFFLMFAVLTVLGCPPQDVTEWTESDSFSTATEGEVVPESEPTTPANEGEAVEPVSPGEAVSDEPTPIVEEVKSGKVTLQLSLQGPNADKGDAPGSFPGWIGLFQTDELPTTKEAMISRYTNASTTAFSYTLTKSTDKAIQVGSKGIYEEIKTKEFVYEMDVELGKTYYFVMFNDWNTSHKKNEAFICAGGFATLSVSIPNDSAVLGQTFPVTFEWYKSKINKVETTLSLSASEK